MSFGCIVMALDQEQRNRLIADTRDAAAAFVEDMDFLREAVVRKDTSRREIRHLSAILRRLIVERDISKIAAPRLGKITITAPDNRRDYRKSEQHPCLLFISAGATIHGVGINRIAVFNVRERHDELFRMTPDEKVERTTAQLNLDQFAQQKVLCYRGQWITRQKVIKYLANIASGVHSGAPEEEDDEVLSKMRSSSSLSVRGDNVSVSLFEHGLDTDSLTISHAPNSVDLVLVETLAAANWLTVSPMLANLEAIIRSELVLPATCAQQQTE
jgi:hypothetical protein